LIADAFGAVVRISFVGVPGRPTVENDAEAAGALDAVTRSVFVPAMVSSVQPPTVATPIESVVCVGSVTLPAPDVTEYVTLTPVTGFPLGSITRTLGKMGTSVPTMADATGVEIAVIDAGAPAIPVAEKSTSTPFIPDTAARKVFCPTVGPTVQDATRATPDASVACVEPVTMPPPVRTANVIVAFGAGLLSASRTSTAGGFATALPATAVWLFPETISMDAGTPAFSITLAFTPGIPSLANESVRGPTVPAIERSAKVATPVLLVTTVVFPESVPPPDVSVTVMATPPRATALPFES
jgi:hypothetical protein